MPISNSFTCPSGHTFNAVAKLRARCPDCGLMARREFGTSSSEAKESKITPTPSIGVKRRRASLRNSSTKEETQTSSEDGSSPVIDSKTEKPSESESKDSAKLTQSPSRRMATVVRRGRVATPKKKPAIVARRNARKSPPSVRRMPEGSKERKVVEQLQGGSKPFWVRVKEDYFRA